MGVLFSFPNANKVIEAIENFGEVVLPEMMAAVLEQAANDLVQNEQEAVPVRTGALQASISAMKISDTAWVVNSELLYYGEYVENGTKNMEAEPFVVPSVELTAAKLPAFIQMQKNSIGE